MKQEKTTTPTSAEVVPLFGRDEMNLIEFPFGPITSGTTKTFEVQHPVFDSKLKREVIRKLLITGSDAFGLPKPVDDQVLMGMKALTYKSGFQSKKVEFSRYQLCKLLGWPTDGRAYLRLEESLDRIAGTTLKFKNSWWDNGEKVYRSKTFHLIEEVEVCSRDRLDIVRSNNQKVSQALCSFVWSDTIWKSFTDGFIKKVDMKMWRKISSKPRKEVALRLYRILDKRFYRKSYVRFDIRKLCIGTLGISQDYAPSQMQRVLERACDWLIECHYLREVRFGTGRGGQPEATFIKATRKNEANQKYKKTMKEESSSTVMKYFQSLPEGQQKKLLESALVFCKKNSPSAFAGYMRNEKHAGATFESYRDLVITNYIDSKKKRKVG